MPEFLGSKQAKEDVAAKLDTELEMLKRENAELKRRIQAMVEQLTENAIRMAQMELDVRLARLERSTNGTGDGGQLADQPAEQ